MEPVQELAFDEIRLSDLADFWTRPEAVREGAFLTLRNEHPIAFFPEPEPPSDMITRGPGYWAITRHAHILHASRHPELFSSAAGATSINDLPDEFNEFFGAMINADDPRHARLRRIVSRGFTPRMLARLDADVTRVAAEIVDDVCRRDRDADGRVHIDFVTEVSAPFPLRIICDMMGIPDSERDFVFEQSNIILGPGDPEYVEARSDIVGALLRAGAALAELMNELAEKRRVDPTDDVTSALVNAEVDGEVLSADELGPFFVLLVTAGNETTRNAISHGVMALDDHPDQRDLWAADVEGVTPTAVEEIVRWATPVIFMRRNVTVDRVRLGDRELSKGDKVLLFYNSANRDADVFDEPFRFDVRRTPNDHVGFGGPGPHFCLGAHLARREIGVMFRELFRRMSPIEVTGEPAMLRSNFIHGVKHLPTAFTPR